MKIGSIINGKEQFIGNQYNVSSFDGNNLADIFYIDNEVLKWILKKKIKFENLYKNYSLDNIINMFHTAGKIFVSDELYMDGNAVGPEEHTKLVSLSTGMPIKIIRNSITLIGDLLFNIEKALKFQVPYGNLNVLKNGYYEVNNKTIGWIPNSTNLFVMLPSNHPNVNYMWIIALALGYPIIIRPSTDDPFTSYRLIKAFIKAGFPCEYFSFFPTEHSSLQYLVDFADFSILFGNEAIEKKYKNNKKIKTFGPGNSAIIVYEEYYNNNKKEVLKIVLKSILDSSGRGCINASSLYFIGDGHELADELCKELCKIKIISPLETDAKIGAIKHAITAEKIDEMINVNITNGCVDITQNYRNTPRLVKLENTQILLPTVLYIEENNILNGSIRFHEFPFPFITFINNCNEENLQKYISNTLSISFLSYKQDILKDILRCPSNGKVFFNKPTNFNDFSDPHDDFISKFLYESKAVILN